MPLSLNTFNVIVLYMATTTTDKAAGLPDGLHASEGVEYLARLEGFQGDHLPAAVILSRGFSETTGFFKDSLGRGYWMTSLSECSCPDWRYRKARGGVLCKHQMALAKALHKRGEAVPGATLQSCGIVPGGRDPLGSGRKLPRMTSEELDARRRRIEERNATRARAPAVEERPFRGFNCTEARA